MQWKVKTSPKVGDKRIIKRFLLLPKTIGDTAKWLEVASWEQEYKTWYHLEYSEIIGSVETPNNIWTDIKWIDKSTV